MEYDIIELHGLFFEIYEENKEVIDVYVRRNYDLAEEVEGADADGEENRFRNPSLINLKVDLNHHRKYFSCFNDIVSYFAKYTKIHPADFDIEYTQEICEMLEPKSEEMFKDVLCKYITFDRYDDATVEDLGGLELIEEDALQPYYRCIDEGYYAYCLNKAILRVKDNSIYYGINLSPSARDKIIFDIMQYAGNLIDRIDITIQKDRIEFKYLNKKFLYRFLASTHIYSVGLGRYEKLDVKFTMDYETTTRLTFVDSIFKYIGAMTENRTRNDELNIFK